MTSSFPSMNLICMIHSRGALLSKATCGNFNADKRLIDALGSTTFRSIHELIAYIREWNNRGCKSIVWRCTTRLDKKGECGARTVNETALKAAFVAALNQMIADSESYLPILQDNIASVLRMSNPELADDIEQIKTICWCGKRAHFNARIMNGKIVTEGEQVQHGGNESYTALCRKHYKEGKIEA